MANVGTVYVDVRADMAGFDNEVDKHSSDMGGKLAGAGKVAGAALAGAATAAVAIAVPVIKEAVSGASDLNEAINVTGLVFGDAATAMNGFFDQSATRLGMNQADARQAAGNMGSLLTNLGYSSSQAADATEGLLERAADLGSAFNAEPADVVQALGAALRGETEPARRFGIMLDQASIKAQAMKMGLADADGQVSKNAMTQAAYALVMQQSDKVANDFTNTASGMANSQRILTAELGDAKATLGTALLPVISELMGSLKDLIPTLKPVLESLGKGLSTALAGAMPAINALVKSLGPLVETLGGALSTALGAVAPVIAQLAPMLGQLAGALGTVLASALQAILPLVGSLLNAIAPLIPPVIKLVDGVVAALTPALDALAPVIGELATELGTALAPMIEALVPVALDLAKAIAELLPPLLPLIKAAFDMTMVTWPLIEPLLKLVDVLLNMLTPILVPLTALIAGLATILSEGMSAAVGAVVGVLAGLIMSLTHVGDAFTGLGKVVTGMASSIATAFTNAWGKVVEIKDRIVGFFGDAGSWLFDAGKRIIGGLIDGIKAMIGSVGSAIGGVVGSITDHFPFSPAKVGPLRDKPPEEAGRHITELFAKGLGSGLGGVGATMTSGLTGLMPAAVAAGGTIDARLINNGTIYGVDDLDAWADQRDAKLVAALRAGVN